MATKAKQIDMGGMTIVCDRIVTGITRPKAGFTVSDSMASGAINDRINVVNITADATKTLTAEQSGSLILLNKADGIVITLPTLSSARVGMYFDFQVNTSVTSNAYKWSTGTQGTEFFNGQVLTNDTDTAASLVAHAGNGSTHDNISMNGTTTGGLIGTRIRLECVSSTLWTVSGINMASGAVATPFSAT